MLRLAVYQGAGTDAAANLRTLDEVLQRHSGHADLVVFPELFLGGYFAQHGAFGADAAGPEDVCRVVARHGVAACLGLAVRSEDGASAPFLNQVLVVDGQGHVLLRHTKTHLWGPFEVTGRSSVGTHALPHAVSRSASTLSPAASCPQCASWATSLWPPSSATRWSLPRWCGIWACWA